MYSVGNLFSTVSKFYNEINPATLSGAIDIIVVQQPNGDLACSPFHVRFGKLSVLRPQDKIVEVRVNGQVIPFQMKVGDLGECFFVLSTEDDVPDEFATSPIARPEDDAKLQPVDYFELDAQDRHKRRTLLQQQQLEHRQIEQGPHGSADLPLDNGYVSAASGHGSAFEESLKGEDSDHESIVSTPGLVSPASQPRPSSPSNNTTMPGSFYEPEEPEAPLPGTTTTTNNTILHPSRDRQEIDFPVDQVFPTVVHREDPSAAEHTAGSNNSAHRRGEVLLDMTGYKTDSCSESDDDGDDDGDLPSAILSDSERRHRGFRRKFGGRRVPKQRHLTEKERLQLIEEIRRGYFGGGRPVDEAPKVAQPVAAPVVVTDASGQQPQEQEQGGHEVGQQEGQIEQQLQLQQQQQESRPSSSGKQRRRSKKTRGSATNSSGGRKGRRRAYSMPSIGESELALLYAQSLQEMKTARTSIKPNGAPRADELKKADTLPRRSARPQVLSDTEMDYESNAPAQKGSEWGWGWGSLPTKKSVGDHTKEANKAPPAAPATPVEIETREFQMGSTKCRVAMSLCGEEELSKDAVSSHSAFQAKQVTFEVFAKDPTSVLTNKALVCYIDGRFYTWANAVPQLTALLFFHQPLPGKDLLGKDSAAASAGGAGGPLGADGGAAAAGGDRPTSSTRFGAISRWFRKAPTSATTTASTTPSSSTMVGADHSGELSPGFASDEEQLVGGTAMNPAMRSKSLPPIDTHHLHHPHHPHHQGKSEQQQQQQDAPLSPSERSQDEEEGAAGTASPLMMPEKRNYAKTLRLSSEQLKQLSLNKGANTVSFSVTSSYQGTATCVAKIFLWDYDAQVVISDIDGTITKSDALGHIFAMAGRDWTHLGVAKLFTDIRSNGYHILYLTSRAIGQADYTRKYLQKVEQNSYQLPDGPVIMSPDRLFSAFHREVIIRKPEVFKMACLRDVKKLFGDKSPFYAGFGNRITDALSYRSVNVPPSRIFTIDSYGEVKLELLSAFKSSYIALNDLVNEIFPGQRVAPEFNDWNYWKTDFSAVPLPDLPLAPNTYGASSSSSLLPSSVKKVLTHSNSSTFSVSSSASASATMVTTTTTTMASSTFSTIAGGPLSPSSTAIHRLSYDSRSSSSQFHQHQHQVEGWTSDDERFYQEHQQQQQQQQQQQLGGAEEALQDDATAASTNAAMRASSPSMLASLVPTRLMRAVRSGSISSGSTPASARPGLTTSATAPPATTAATVLTTTAEESTGSGPLADAETSTSSSVLASPLPVEEEEEKDEGEKVGTDEKMRPTAMQTQEEKKEEQEEQQEVGATAATSQRAVSDGVVPLLKEVMESVAATTTAVANELAASLGQGQEQEQAQEQAQDALGHGEEDKDKSEEQKQVHEEGEERDEDARLDAVAAAREQLGAHEDEADDGADMGEEEDIQLEEQEDDDYYDDDEVEDDDEGLEGYEEDEEDDDYLDKIKEDLEEPFL
ncbi:hypothetical protein DFQ27_007192 [Actinomortierella ambigua]|uniref:phosphatidate phosphatase n=1 Tax=Actinomortierella ambigua TaxID=1343610 RepID=A0A9P6PVT3_9FUNG|nr:hypothetical protein DFQ27_007192 [Actinomortierella ambigua]